MFLLICPHFLLKNFGDKKRHNSVTFFCYFLTQMNYFIVILTMNDWIGYDLSIVGFIPFFEILE